MRPYLRLIPALLLAVTGAVQARAADNAVSGTADLEQPGQRPNILLIVAEDMSARVGSYGDAVARTPAIDELAAEGIRFSRAYTIAGVCAPSRSSLITGVYATSMGTHQMRTSQGVPGTAIESYEAVPPAAVKAFPELLRRAGYSTANFAKKDYQFGEPFTIWDVDTGKFIGPIDPALWRRLPEGKPWFVMMNLVSTHESRLVDSRDSYPPRLARFVDTISRERAATVTPLTRPADVSVPPYFPDTPRVRESIAQHYDNIHYMDSQVASMLAALQADGLDDNTIVIWTTDHGDAFPRAKRAVYESGTHVPLIVRFPDRRDAGTVEERFMSFVDIAPTILRWAGAPVPAFIQGRDMFQGQPREHVFAARDRMDETHDRVRAVRDERYRLVENFAPDIAYFRPLLFRDMFPIMRELWRGHREGFLAPEQAYYFTAPRPRYELYDVQQDPHEIHNLADDPHHAAVRQRLIATLDGWRERVGDLGDVSEEAMVHRMWGGAEQPVTAQPEVEFTAGATGELQLQLSAATDGSSLGYAVDGDPWMLYRGPVAVPAGSRVQARAVRYGFRESDVVEASAVIRPDPGGSD